MIRRSKNSRGRGRERKGRGKIKTEMGLVRLKERDAADMWPRLWLIRGGGGRRQIRGDVLEGRGEGMKEGDITGTFREEWSGEGRR